MSSEKEKPEETPKPRRRWKRWVLGFFVVLALFLVWANGPGARWAVKKVILQQLEAQKLSGTFEVEGSALSGLSIHKLSLTGESKIQSVESDLLKIDWSLSSLLNKELEGLTLEKLHLVIDPSAPALPETNDQSETSEKDSAPLSQTLDLVRGILQPARISISDLQVEIVDLRTITLGSLTHSAGTGNYQISDLKTSDHLNRLIHNPASTLTWNNEGFELDQIALLPQLNLRNLQFVPEQKAKAEVFLNQKKIELTSDLRESHRITLASPTLSIDSIVELVDPKLKASGTITALEIDTAKGLVHLHGSDLEWDGQKLASASIEARTKDLLSPFDQPVELTVSLADLLKIDGSVTPNKDPLDSAADLSFTLTYPDVPTVTGELAYDAREARVIANTLDDLRLTARYFVDSSTYEAEAISKIKEAGTLEKSLSGLLDFTASAKGDLKAETHTGTLTLNHLKLAQPDLPKATTKGLISWNWPTSVTVQNLTMTSPEGELEAQLSWQDDLLTLTQLDLVEGGAKLLSASGKLPAPLDTKGLDDLLDSQEPISLKIKSQPLSFKKLSSFAPIPSGLSAIFEADLTLEGTLAKPSLNGFATVTDFRTSAQPDLPPVDLSLDFKTQKEKLTLTAKATEPGGPLINVDGSLPFLPRAWIDRRENPNDSPVNLRAYSPELDLRRVQPFVPVIESITGNLKLDFLMSGTISEPTYSGTARANIANMRLARSPISDFRNTRFSATFRDKTVTVEPSIVSASGGTANVSGTIDLAGAEPVFDLNLNGRFILLHRTADYTFRGHPDLNLRGPFSKAIISGKLEVTESLFYKDLEILPFGVPRTTDIPRPNLPSFSQKPSRKPAARKSAGVMDWRLNIDVTTADPILIRGNLARGEITGKIKVTGTIGDPRTDGKLTAKDLVADLPFSELQVQTGVVTLRPDSLTNPLVDLRGSSTIGQYTVQVFLTGPVQNPNLILTSNPPLPESEIMLLLATGSASAQLEDRQVASQKALQYLLEGLRRRNRGKDKTVLQRLLKNSDQIELSLGDSNQFSGRKFSSATLEINDQWDFTTQIDDQGQTRALVVFSVRLR